MDKTPLNKAHEVGRRAVKFVRRGQLPDAIECHLKAAAILYELQATLSEDSQCRRSLAEQLQFHKRQAELAEVLKNFFDKGSKSEGAMDKPMERKRVLQPTTSSNRLQLHPEILKQIDEADSLLQILSGRQLSTVLPSDVQMRTQSTDDAVRAIEFTIRPKNDAEVIEELQIVNSNLRSLVDKLLEELSLAKKENDNLRERLAEYESAVNKRGRQADGAGKQALSDYLGDSQEILTAAEVLRQSSMISRENIPDIPELDPLDSPEFHMPEFKAHK